jgi:hypothetical protein
VFYYRRSIYTEFYEARSEFSIIKTADPTAEESRKLKQLKSDEARKSD